MLSTSQLTLRRAHPGDVALLRCWDQQPHVLASDPNDDWGWEVELARDPDWREQLVAQIDGRPIGFIQIIDPAREDSHYWGDVPAGLRAIDIWIGEAAELGKGYGTRMMQLALERCFADVGTVGLDRFQRLAAILAGGDDFELGPGPRELGEELVAEQGFVFGDDAFRHWNWAPAHRRPAAAGATKWVR